MSITLIAVIVALVLGHLAPGLAATVRRHGWFAAWVRWLDARFVHPDGFWRGRWGVMLALLPPLVLVIALQVLVHHPLAGVLGLLLGTVALFHAWGPADLDVDVARVVNADDAATRADAARRLGAATLDGAGLVSGVFASALRRWFGVLFWFLLLGAAGALLYRWAQLAAEAEEGNGLPAANRDGARALYAVLNWPVAQAMTLTLALVGNFDLVISAWRDNGGSTLRLREHGFLDAAARASVRSEVAEEADELIEEGATPGNAWLQLGELPELRDAMSLVWRILLLWLVVLALFVVAGWVS